MHHLGAGMWDELCPCFRSCRKPRGLLKALRVAKEEEQMAQQLQLKAG